MADLPTFRRRVRELYRAIPHPTLPRQFTAEDLAEAIGLTASELSRRLTGKGKVALSAPNCHAIVRQLAQWQALQSQAEAVELLRLVDCPPFSPKEWQHPPLSLLLPFSPILAAEHGMSAHNLPTPISSFIGRSEDKAQVLALLQKARLLTLTGSGGIGKTRLALEVAKAALTHYSHGAWLVKLAPLTNAELIIPTIGQAIGCREESGRPLIESITDYLRFKRLLLVLDNCEHLQVGCAEVMNILLSDCPHLTVLATSRVALGIAGEVDWLLLPLATPDQAVAPPSELMKYEAVALFTSRAAAAKPSFGLSVKNAASVVEICHHLEGIPLALELAAALIKVMSLTKLASKLSEQLQWLTSADATAPERLRSLRGTIEWSYNLLSADAKCLLRRLSVFNGGWTLEAAEIICGDEHLPRVAVWSVHIELIRGSLVVASSEDAEDHYHMLEVIREYAAAQLVSSGEEVALRLHHAMWYLTLAEQGVPARRSIAQAEWLNRLEAVLGNLRAALTWMLTYDLELAARLAWALLWFWTTRGYISEGRKFLERIIVGLGDESQLWRARMLEGASELANYQGDYQLALKFNAEALVLERQLGDEQGLARTRLIKARVVRAEQDYEGSRKLLEEALAVYRELGDQEGTARTLLDLADNAYYRYDYEAAQRLYEESLAISKQRGNRWGIAYAFYGLGDVASMQGDYVNAQQFLVKGLTLFHEQGDRMLLAYVLFTLGRVMLSAGGEHGAEQAVRLCSAGAALFSRIDVSPEPIEAAKSEQTVASCRQTLSAQAFDVAWQGGPLMTLTEVVDYAASLLIIPQVQP